MRNVTLYTSHGKRLCSLLLALTITLLSYSQSTIFSSSSAPAVAAATDGTPIETGVKFRASQAGYITGVRFYKGTANTGTHIGHLWSSTGTKLAEITFTGESASGWQQMSFTNPVAINANTTYVASYFSSSGYYAYTDAFFTSATVNGPLTGLANGTDGGNGVYIYAASSAFPNNSYQSTNYWVDVVYTTSIGPDVTPPTVNITAPAAGNVSGTITVTANASDNVGVAGVQFQLNGVNLGSEDLASPYNISWNTTTSPNGNYTLTAIARDAAGNTTTSAGVAVTINNDTQAPTVSITAPTAGTVSGTISVTASASDNVGVAGVQFLLDGANLGSEDAATPYSVSWNTTTATNGNHTLTARARDAAGNTTTSSGVVVTVNNAGDTQAPTVSITAPAAGIVSGVVTVTANASDNVGVVGVQFLLNGANLGTEDAASPYNISWNTTTVANGNYTLTARARDAAGNSTTSAPVNVTVNNSSLIAALPFNEGTGTTTADISGNNHPGSLVNSPIWSTGKYGQGLTFNGTSSYVGIADHVDFTLAPTQSYTWSAWVNNNTFTQGSTVWSQTASNTNYFYIAANTSTDADGGPVTNGISVYWRTGSNKLACHSTNNVLTAGQWSYVAVTYDASQPQNNRFTIYVNGVDVTDRTDISSAGTLGSTNPTNTRIASNQPLALFLNGSIDEVRFYKRLLSLAEVQSDMNTPMGTDNVSPTVSITAPAAGNVSGTISVTASASDNVAVVGVQFLLDGASLGNEDLASPYSVSWNTGTTTNGSHTLTARARDGAGNITTSTAIVVNVSNDTVAPTINITAPTGGTVTGTINVTANASDNVAVVGVQFLLDGGNLGSEDLGSPYSLSWNSATTTNGSHTLTARARDAAGNTTTSAGVVVTVSNDTQAPTVSITSPTGGTVSGTINVTANASDNVGVVGLQFLLDGNNLGSEDLGTPYTVSWNTTTATSGNHTLTARARDAAGNTTTSAAIVVNVQNDSQAPTISITAPASGSVSGTVTVSANASDNVGVVGVQFLLDGANLGSEDLATPYNMSWNTTTATNGNHTLTARARDAAGNTTVSSGVTVTVTNASSLIAALNLNEGSGTSAADVSGNNHNGTLTNGPTWVTGKYGQAVNFNGSNYINIPAQTDFNLNPAQSYTWSAWVKNTDFHEWSPIWSQTVDVNNFFYFYAHTTTDVDGGPVTNGISVYWWNSGGTNKIGAHSSSNVLTAGQWSYVSVVYDATQPQNNRFTIYVNGVDVTVRTDVSSVGTIAAINATNIRIGSDQPFNEFLNGAIDEVRVYRRALSGSEITTDMNTPIATGIFPSVNPQSGATNVSLSTNITAVFNVDMNASTINSSTFALYDANHSLVPGTISYNSSTRTATFAPSSPLNGSSQYTGEIDGGSSGVKDVAGNSMSNNLIWSFTTLDPQSPPITEGPGGPILIISNPSNPFTRYTVEILRAEGLNEFSAADIGSVTSTMLNNYDVVILGDMTVTSSQVTMLTNWVNAGGKLIAFKPSSLLTPLMGLSSAGGTLSDKYLLVNTTSGPGVGIVNQTIQYHGVANLHTLNGATSLATLYSTSSGATSNPAVTIINVGPNGGKAIAFTYDLARSIVYTRQGDPTKAGVETDGQSPIRPDDLFFPSYVDLNKVAIPQADEQQRLLANIIIQSNLNTRPLPRFWYLPNGYKAAVIYALDDHGSSSGTPDIFNKMIANSNAGCSVDNWECLRATSWFYVGIPMTNSQAVSYLNQGFDMGVHVQNGCNNFSSFSNLDANYVSQLGSLHSAYPGLPDQIGHRFHCLVWSDWLTQAKVELSHGMRFSLDYYYWPPSWINGRPGVFTGSGMPMRFADLDGTMIDIYQGVSQLVNENGIDYTVDISTLLDNAIGSKGYYGMFGTHDDYRDVTYSNVTIAQAKQRNVPIISVKQALTWLDGRNNSSFDNLSWDGSQLNFTVTAMANANNIQAMLPFNSASGQLLSITRNGNSVSFNTQTIKGMQYAFFAPATGTNNYVATYSSGARIAGNPVEIIPVTPPSTTTETSNLPLAKAAIAEFSVSVMPNPSSESFTMYIGGSDAAPVAIRISDMSGRQVETFNHITAGAILKVGQNWASGTYVAEVTQGSQRKVIKLIKTN